MMDIMDMDYDGTVHMIWVLTAVCHKADGGRNVHLARYGHLINKGMEELGTSSKKPMTESRML